MYGVRTCFVEQRTYEYTVSAREMILDGCDAAFVLEIDVPDEVSNFELARCRLCSYRRGYGWGVESTRGTISWRQHA